MRNDRVVIDTTHGLIYLPHLMMQAKTTSNETTAKPQPVITDDALKIPPRTIKTITAFVNHPSEWNTTGTVTPFEKFKFRETASLLTSVSMSTIFDKRIAIRVTNTTESPYLKKTQIAEFCVVTPEQSKHIKPVDMAILSIIPQSDPDLTA